MNILSKVCHAEIKNRPTKLSLRAGAVWEKWAAKTNEGIFDLESSFCNTGQTSYLHVAKNFTIKPGDFRNFLTAVGVSRGRAAILSWGRNHFGGLVVVSGVNPDGEKNVKRIGVSGFFER